MSQYDLVIVGAGIVGSAFAWKFKKKFPHKRVILIEKESCPGAHQTGHNSGVIHSGIYYKPGSQKALNCLNGYRQMIDFCNDYEVPYELCGKVIVATTSEEFPYLETLFSRGQKNGLKGLQLLGREEILEKEPHIAGIKGIYVPQAGIIDYKTVLGKMIEEYQKLGGETRFGCFVTQTKASKFGKSEIITETDTLLSKQVVFSCGLYADRMASNDKDFRILPFRGEYYQIKPERAHLVNGLVYPVPNPNFPFLGVHLTKMISGKVEAGPNAVLALKREGYKKTDINFYDLYQTLTWPGFIKVASRHWLTGLGEIHRSMSKSAFTKALQRLLPELKAEDLIPGPAGVRAQASDKFGLVDDFDIRSRANQVHVCNAPSPAATSSLSIADKIMSYVNELY